jgi:putative flavoprotein involved in K+ transport
MSRCLRDRGLEHVVLERGRVAERWRRERWDSLRLLTPNWHSRLPGWRYTGPDPDGYMSMPEVIDYLEGYARSFTAPVEEGTHVQAVTALSSGYRVTTSRGLWTAPNVVIATGHCDLPRVPAFAAELPADILQVTPNQYRNPGRLPAGGVLVVGASATGVQLAEEIHTSGRPVTLAVGRHTRMPRRYRGRDILWWLDALGAFEETIAELKDPVRSRQQPSLQLVGRPDHATLDLPRLESQGVRLVGRGLGVSGRRLILADDLVAHTAAADAKLAKLIARIDAFVVESGWEGTVEPAEPFEPFLWPAPAPTELDLDAAGIRTVIWATGFRRSYPWLQVDVLDPQGEIRHQGGITPASGLYALGLLFLRRRNSNFIDGVGKDAAALADHIAARRPGTGRAVA